MAFPEGFGRLKKPMVQRMAKLADIKHVSGTMTEDMRSGLHRYLKEQAPLFASPNADETVTVTSPSKFIIPHKTFAFLVQKAAGIKMGPGAIDAFHNHVEAWWLELFKRSKKIADHREHAVVQWKDVELVMELAQPIIALPPIPLPPPLALQPSSTFTDKSSLATKPTTVQFTST